MEDFFIKVLNLFLKKGEKYSYCLFILDFELKPTNFRQNFANCDNSKNQITYFNRTTYKEIVRDKETLLTNLNN